LGRHALQHWAERPARAAPWRPEIHHYGNLFTPPEDLLFKILQFVGHLNTSIIMFDLLSVNERKGYTQVWKALAHFTNTVLA
jgi:hypothetical protein